MRIKDAIENAKETLKENNIEDSTIIARELLSFILKENKLYLVINQEKELSKEISELYLKNMNEIIQGKPIQYITNKQEFMGFNFYVNESVLIPQPDTEILVEGVLDICKKMINVSAQRKNINILDICTGSGAIAISIAKILSQKNITANITASDISKEALQIAKKNNNSNNTNIKFVLSDLFAEFENNFNKEESDKIKNYNINKEQFDIIVSNPPYIKSETIKQLSKQVQNEPILALDGGKDGLDFYKKIISEAYKYIKNNGYLCLEIGFDQKDDVLSIMKEYSQYEKVKVLKDLSGNDRCVICNINK